MKMREALVIAMKAICHHARANHTCDSLAWENSTINENCGDILCAHRDLCEAKTAIQKALSAPPRNCDVGTAEEKVARYHAYCYRMMKQNNHCCGPCPCHKFVNGEAQPCTLIWAQMPYEEERKGEGDGR
jgi:hypothetical protein